MPIVTDETSTEVSGEVSAAQHFLAKLQKFFEQAAFVDGLKTVREKSFARLLEKGLPERKASHHRGAFQYVPLREFYAGEYAIAAESQEVVEADISAFVYPECVQARLVFVDGYFDEKLSDLKGLPKQVVVLPLDKAMRTYGHYLNTRFSKKEEEDSFALLNLALHPKGAFVFVPPHTQIETPLQILYVTTARAGIITQPRLHLLVGAHSEVKLISKAICLSSGSSVFNGVCEMSLDENAQVHHVDVVQSGKAAWHFDALRATLKKNSCLKSLCVTRGSKTVRKTARISLVGEGAEALLQGVWKLSGLNQAHAHITMEHEAPHTRSMQVFKGVLADASQSSFEGKIFVAKVAQKTEAYQLNHNLLVGERAIANSKPNLEVFADDVKASHGATIAQLPKEPLLYLRTRGIGEEMAKKLLVTGFYKELIDAVPYNGVRDELNALLRD